ncbi:MAG: helix-turn-helix domain-containing protein [Proteobacteria bacterium]|nr:helix-turn-helix domain-containing protein [Pseudomonadota bacterium]
MTSVQTKITELMTQKKITVLDIEKNTGINRNTIYSILSGTSKNPSASNLQLIAKALGVPLQAILVDEAEIRSDLLNHKQMETLRDVTTATINMIIEKNNEMPLNKIVSLIKEVYLYSIKLNPPSIDNRFIDWLIDKNKY